MTAPNAKPDRNACVVRDYTHGAMTMAEVGRAYGITKQRVSQIIRAERLREQRDRCERGEHGDVTERQHTVWIWGKEPTVVRSAVCNDCGEEVER